MDGTFALSLKRPNLFTAVQMSRKIVLARVVHRQAVNGLVLRSITEKDLQDMGVSKLLGCGVFLNAQICRKLPSPPNGAVQGKSKGKPPFCGYKNKNTTKR